MDLNSDMKTYIVVTKPTTIAFHCSWSIYWLNPGFILPKTMKHKLKEQLKGNWTLKYYTLIHPVHTYIDNCPSNYPLHFQRINNSQNQLCSHSHRERQGQHKTTFIQHIFAYNTPTLDSCQFNQSSIVK